MASAGVPATADSSSTAIDLPPNTHVEPAQTLQSTPFSSTPVEMTNLNPPVATQDAIETSVPTTMSNSSSAIRDMSKENERPGTSGSLTTAQPTTQAGPSSPPTNGPPISATSPPTSLVRQQTAPAIGPASDKPTPMPKEQAGMGPSLMITLLLNTGARHPYRIDEKYLKKRNVSVPGNDPVNMSVYTLKELIWRDWREEWEARPSSPSSIRLIHFGKLLDDKAYLKDGRFESGPTPHVVHMTIKPQDIVDEEDAKTGKSGGRDRDGNER
ncbi:MAG: hypothetical protein LQ347_005143, partial [Umbilicaria vellea]